MRNTCGKPRRGFTRSAPTALSREETQKLLKEYWDERVEKMLNHLYDDMMLGKPEKSTTKE